MRFCMNQTYVAYYEIYTHKTLAYSHDHAHQTIPSYQPHDIENARCCFGRERPNTRKGVLEDRGGGKISLGRDFYFSSGKGVNPIAGNTQGAVYIEDGARLTIGAHVGMSSTRLWVHDSVTIGDNVKIGACVLITDTDAHPMDYMARRTTNEGTKSAPIVIEDDVWIGAHSVVLKGVTIGARSIIGAGSVVTRSIPADCVAAGNPCRVIRRLNC